MALMSNR